MEEIVALSTVLEVSRREGIGPQAALNLIRARRRADAERIARDSYLGALEEGIDPDEPELNPNELGILEYARRTSRGR